jgi:AraC-like DNA-binding protein
MTVFKELNFDDHGQIVVCSDDSVGLRAINTRHGPSIGGCRMWSYADESEALSDVLHLSRGMTYKAAMAGIELGGGKSVIIGDSTQIKTPTSMQAMGRAVAAERLAKERLDFAGTDASSLLVQELHGVRRRSGPRRRGALREMARTDSRNSSKYWQDLDIPGLSLLYADFTTHEYAPHTHDAYVVAVTERGGAEFKSRGIIDRAQASALLVFNPQEPHSGWLGASKRWSYRSFYLTDSAMESVRAGLGIQHAPYFCANVFRDEQLINDFALLHRSIEAKESAFAVRSRLYLAFGKLFERYSSPIFRPEKPTYEQVLAERMTEYMCENYAKDISLGELASSFNLTPFQMIRCFNRTVGLPPYAFLTQIRLRAACRLLRQGQSFVDAALAVGFYDQSAFNKHFKRAYGITPRQFVAAAN